MIKAHELRLNLKVAIRVAMNITDELLSAVRSLFGYESYAQQLKKNGNVYLDVLIKQGELFGLTDNEKQFLAILDKFGKNAFLEGARICKNAYARTSRAKKRIEYILTHFENSYFVTFTLNDEYVDLSFDTLALRVKRVCKLFSSVWICNDDYGDKYGRLHFHAVMSDDKVSIDLLDTQWKFGFVKVEKIRIDEQSSRRLARYVTKLARHAVKYSAGKNWYSRLS